MALTPERRYQTLLDKLLTVREVSQSRRPGFGAGLRFEGKVFAMLVNDRLVLKLRWLELARKSIAFVAQQR